MKVVRSGWWGDHTNCCSGVRFALCGACSACLAVLVSAQAAPPTGNFSPCYLYSRDLPTTVWGFLLALVALTVDDWGLSKNVQENIYMKVLQVVLGGILNPFFSLTERMQLLVYGMKMRKRMSGTPSAIPYIKVLSGCQVLVNLSPAAAEKLRHLRDFDMFLEVQDLSDALVIGRPIQAKNLVQLSGAGREALIRAEILPPVAQLKVVQGYSGVAVAASAIQGVGYIYGIVVRLVQGLHVSPLEAMAFMLNVVVLAKAMWHFYSSSCHRPLLLFLEADEEDKFIAECEAPGASWDLTTSEERKFSLLCVGGIAIIPGGILMFFIIQITNATSLIVVIPLIILEGALLLAVCTMPFIMFSSQPNLIPEVIIYIIIPLLFLIGYVYGLVVSVKYWESRGFNIRSSNYLAQILPYLG